MPLPQPAPEYRLLQSLRRLVDKQRLLARAGRWEKFAGLQPAITALLERLEGELSPRSTPSPWASHADESAAILRSTLHALRLEMEGLSARRAQAGRPLSRLRHRAPLPLTPRFTAIA